MRWNHVGAFLAVFGGIDSAARAIVGRTVGDAARDSVRRAIEVEVVETQFGHFAEAHAAPARQEHQGLGSFVAWVSAAHVAQGLRSSSPSLVAIARCLRRVQRREPPAHRRRREVAPAVAQAGFDHLRPLPFVFDSGPWAQDALVDDRLAVFGQPDHLRLGFRDASPRRLPSLAGSGGGVENVFLTRPPTAAVAPVADSTRKRPRPMDPRPRPMDPTALKHSSGTPDSTSHDSCYDVMLNDTFLNG